MQQIKRAWNNQDLANKVILVTGVIMAIVCLVMGQGKYGVVFMVLMLAFVAAHTTQRAACTAACTSTCPTARWCP